MRGELSRLSGDGGGGDGGGDDGVAELQQSRRHARLAVAAAGLLRLLSLRARARFDSLARSCSSTGSRLCRLAAAPRERPHAVRDGQGLRAKTANAPPAAAIRS